MTTKSLRSPAFAPISRPSPDRAIPGNLDRLGLASLSRHNGARIEFFLKASGRQICGFGKLFVSQDQDGSAVVSIRRMSSFRDGCFEEQEFKLTPSSAQWIRFHREPTVATLALYEP